MTLEARGTTSTRTMRVRGDPHLPITDSQYRMRERYLIALNEVQVMLNDDRVGVPEDLARRIRQQMRWLSVTGSGFRGGSYFGPTVAQRDALAEIQRALAELRDTRR